MYRFVNFKGFADASLELERTPMTLLVGRNGAGKTNAIEAIALLAGLLGGDALTEVSDLGAGGKLQVRGGLAGCIGLHGQDFSIEFAIGQEFTYSLTIRMPHEPTARPSVWRERLEADGKVLFESARRGPELLRVKFEGKGRSKPKQLNLPDHAPTIARLSLMPQLDPSEALVEARDVLLHAASTVLAFDPVPRSMRGFAAQHDTRLHPSGANLAAVLYALHQGGAEEQATLRRIVECIGNLPEEPVASIRFIPVKETGQVTFGLMNHDRVLAPAQVMSDGTLRALAIITAVETAPSGALVLVEEFDNGLHPSRSRTVLDFLWKRATEREVRVLATTHNPATLDALTSDQMRGVVLCWWDGASKASELRHLTDLPDSQSLLSPGHLGDDVTKERYRSRLVPIEEYERQRKEGLARRFAELEQLSKYREAK